MSYKIITISTVGYPSVKQAIRGRWFACDATRRIKISRGGAARLISSIESHGKSAWIESVEDYDARCLRTILEKNENDTNNKKE